MMLEMRTLLREARKSESKQGSRALRLADNVLTISDVVKMHRTQGRLQSGVDETWLRLQLQAVLDGRASMLGPYDDIDGCWKNEPCFVVGGSRGLGNAIKDGFKLSMLDGFHSIGINHVVEDYHNFEWLFFMDKRLLDISKWDIMKEFKGRIFAHVKTRIAPSKNTVIVYTQSDGPAENIVQGLYSFVVSGMTALNLALIAGAQPIYLLGLDNGGATHDHDGTHYKADYPGEVRNRMRSWSKFLQRIPEMCLKYAPWADRFVNVDPLGDITVFKKMSVRDIPELKGKL